MEPDTPSEASPVSDKVRQRYPAPALRRILPGTCRKEDTAASWANAPCASGPLQSGATDSASARLVHPLSTWRIQRHLSDTERARIMPRPASFTSKATPLRGLARDFGGSTTRRMFPGLMTFVQTWNGLFRASANQATSGREILRAFCLVGRATAGVPVRHAGGFMAQVSPRALHKAHRIAQVLDSLYPDPPETFLPHANTFELLIKVLLSAQSTDVKVNKTSPALFAAMGHTAVEMAVRSPKDVEDIIRPIGLAPTKARNIVALSKQLVNVHGGQVPDTLEELEALPGVGHKTASVVLIHGFGKPAFPVDTHIHRLACRWGIGDAKSVDRTETALKAWFPDQARWHRLHIQLISFGRDHCPARNHNMDQCPICRWAATPEARASNRRSPNKFIAALRHNDPEITIDDNGSTLDHERATNGHNSATTRRLPQTRSRSQSQLPGPSTSTPSDGHFNQEPEVRATRRRQIKKRTSKVELTPDS
mmetsp:Transcript_4272/g.8383  ORF Transcript_4272/g.8383 Transcript_4272/m.8383 type:complete len:481 (+) Transcript_4272:3246-4688(+)